MSDFENLLDGVDKPKEPETQATVSEESPETSNTPTPKDGPWNIYEDDVDPKKPNVDMFKKHYRMFMASSPIPIPNERLEILDRIVEKCNASGFTFRSMADDKDRLNAEITDRITRKEYILPWKKFNESVEAKVFKPSKTAAEIACYLEVEKKGKINAAKNRQIPREDIIKDYNLLKPGVKLFTSRNVHLMLGDDCETVVNFLLVYTDDGAETPREIKWDKSQKTGNFIEMAYNLSIPVFNLKKSDVETRIIEFLNTFN